MEEPQIIEEPAIAGQRSQVNKKPGKPASGKKKKMSGVALSSVIALITFALGLILCIIPDLMINEQVTGFFENDAAFVEIGRFFDPLMIFYLEFSGLTSGAIGSLFGELTIIIGAVIVIITFAIGQGEIKKAKKENRKAVMPPITKLYKYGWLPVLPALIGAGIFFMLAALGLMAFFSFHMVIATSTTGLSLAYLGSRKKALSFVFAFASIFYVVMMGIGRMADGKPFIAVLVGGFITFAIAVVSYFSILDVPGQEMIYRHQSTFGPFNEGYKLILDGKANLKENQAEAIKSVTTGLEKLAVAKANAEDINKFHHDLDGFIARVDDITGRIGILLQQQPINPKNWSYLC